MRLFLIPWLIVIAAAVPAAAQETGSPEATVKEIYRYYESNGSVGIWPSDPLLKPLFTERLMVLLEADDELAQRQGIGRLGFDPFVDAQDFALQGFDFSTARQGEIASVEARFQNFGEPTRIVYTLVREADGWRIADIAAPDGPYPWRLSELLAGD